MTKPLFRLSFLCSAIILTASVSQGQSTSQLHFPKTGFSIAPLEAPLSQAPQQALMMFLPSTDGFAPNVNVEIQPYAGTMDDYVALSLAQFKSAKMKVLHQKTYGKSVAVFEYTGEARGQLLHWYAKAEKCAGRVYLVTATATQGQWSKVAAPLKACVDSFRCDSGEQNALPTAVTPGR